MGFIEASRQHFRQVWLRSLAVALLCFVATSLQAAEPASLKGVALIVGQSKYEHIAALANPAGDARDMAKMLTDLGFDARSVTGLSDKPERYKEAIEQNNLGDIHSNRASYGGDDAEYRKAIAFFENAKQGFTEAGYTIPIPLTTRRSTW